MRIITDTGRLISREEAKQLGIELVPLQVEVGGDNYLDYLNISSE